MIGHHKVLKIIVVLLPHFLATISHDIEKKVCVRDDVATPLSYMLYIPSVEYIYIYLDYSCS